MKITLFSILMTIIFSLLFTFILYVCRKSNTFIRVFGINSLMILAVVCIARTIFPVEFFFTKEVAADKPLNSLASALTAPIIEDNQYTLILILLVIQVSSTIILGLSLFLRLNRNRLFFNLIPVKANRKIENVLKRIVPDKDIDKISVTILDKKLTHLGQITNVPIITGFSKAVIILPHSHYTERELEFIFKHEYIHYKNKDTYISLLLDILLVFMWWNPFLYLIKKDLADIMEIKCDNELIDSLSKDERVEYLKTLKAVLQEANESLYIKTRNIPFIVAEFANRPIIEQRFELIREPIKHRQRKQKFFLALWIALIVSCFMLSYSFVIQSYFDMPQDYLAGQYEITPQNSYLILNSDSTYTFYSDDGTTQNISNEAAEQMITVGYQIKEKEE